MKRGWNVPGMSNLLECLPWRRQRGKGGRKSSEPSSLQLVTDVDKDRSGVKPVAGRVNTSPHSTLDQTGKQQKGQCFLLEFIALL